MHQMTFERHAKDAPDPCRIKAHFVVVPLALLDAVSPKALALYLRATCLGGSQACGYFESQETIAAWLHVTDRTVRSLIKELQEAGTIFKDGHSGHGLFKGTTVLRCREIEGDFQTIPASFLDHIGIGGDPRRLLLSVFLARKVRGSQAILTRAEIAKETRISKNEMTRLLIELEEAEWVKIQHIRRRLLIKSGRVMNELHRRPQKPSDSALEPHPHQENQSPCPGDQDPSDFRLISLDSPGELPRTSDNSEPLHLKSFYSKPLHSSYEGSGPGPILDRAREEDKQIFQLIADLCHRSIPRDWWDDGVDSRWRTAGHPKTIAAAGSVFSDCCLSAENVNDRIFLPLSIWIRLNGCAKDVQAMKTPALIANIIQRFHESGVVMSENHLQCPVYWHEHISFDKEYTTIGDLLERFFAEVELLHDAGAPLGDASPEWLGLAVLETRAAYEEGFVSPADHDWHDLMGFPLDEEDALLSA
jgi:biotin operon repressor